MKTKEEIHYQVKLSPIAQTYIYIHRGVGEILMIKKREKWPVMSTSFNLLTLYDKK